MKDELTTSKDIMKDLGKIYEQLGKKLYELDRLIHKEKRK